MRQGISAVQDPEWSISGKRLILTVTTGRSGTGYLCNLVQGLPDICCFHEPHPKFSSVMRAAQTQPRIAEDFLRELKLPAIRRVSERVYFETSHLACKGFLEPLVERGLCPDLVILRRDPFLVATSLFLLDTIPSRTPLGFQFLLGPEDPGVLRIDPWKDLHDWALCYWYCLEIERRALIYKQRVEHLGSRVLLTSVADLKTDTGFRELLEFLDQDPTTLASRRSERGNAVVNDKAANKDPERAKTIDAAMIADMAAEVEYRISRCRESKSHLEMLRCWLKSLA